MTILWVVLSRALVASSKKKKYRARSDRPRDQDPLFLAAGDVAGAFTAHQLFTILKEASHTVVFIEHDSSMYDGAWEMITPIAGALREIGHESMVILYSVTPDRAFSALIQKADRVYSLSSVEDNQHRHAHRSSRSQTQRWQHHSPQRSSVVRG